MSDKMYDQSAGETGDVIAAAQRLIEAGVRNDDSESIEAGRKKWKEIWPEDVVDLHVDLYIKDLKEELLQV